MEQKTKKIIISWIIFLILLFGIGVLLYFLFGSQVLDYRMGVCLSEFKESYDKHGLIYEYDSYCKEVFSDYNNFEYCGTYSDLDFCTYSFANFLQDKDIRLELCNKIIDLKLNKDCSNFFLEI